jgi:hypothetical protein
LVWFFLCCITPFPFVGLPDVHAQSDGTTEYAVKAGFLYNFAKFIEWPPDSFASGTAPISFVYLAATRSVTASMKSSWEKQ